MVTESDDEIRPRNEVVELGYDGRRDVRHKICMDTDDDL